MQEYWVKLEPWIRLSFFSIFLAALIYFEQKFSWRTYFQSIKNRLMYPLSLVLVSNFLIRLIFPVMLVGLAVSVQQDNQSSLFQLPEFQALPVWTHYVLGFLFLDFVMYWQHRVFHRVGLFWRLHMMHHTDLVLDATTGIRFHPLEYLIANAVKMLAIVFLAPPPAVVLVYEVVLNFSTMFAHANLDIPMTTDLKLRRMIVTPGMHRVHHSDIPAERNHNFGFVFSWWDRLLGTYLAYSRMPGPKLLFGVEEFRDPKYQTIQGTLLQPFYRHSKMKKPKIIRKLLIRMAE